LKDQAELLAIVEVEKENRVYCQAQECKRTVYKRIHVVRDKGGILVLGQRCFAVKYAGKCNEGANLTNGHTRTLTEEERLLLVENTERLIQQFQAEHQCRLSADKKTPLVNVPQNKEKQKPFKPSSSNLSDNRCGPPREVKCHYCRGLMLTTLTFTPGSGFKCDECVAKNRRLPSINRYRRS